MDENKKYDFTCPICHKDAQAISHYIEDCKPAKEFQPKPLFVATAYRWGERENHSYVVGVFSTKERAEYAADVEYTWRGCGKYECKIDEVSLDEINAEADAYHKSCIRKDSAG